MCPPALLTWRRCMQGWLMADRYKRFKKYAGRKDAELKTALGQRELLQSFRAFTAEEARAAEEAEQERMRLEANGVSDPWVLGGHKETRPITDLDRSAVPPAVILSQLRRS